MGGRGNQKSVTDDVSLLLRVIHDIDDDGGPPPR